MAKRNRFDSPAQQTIRFLAKHPHTTEYRFPEKNGIVSNQATHLVFYRPHANREHPDAWLATIDYTKPWDQQVSVHPQLKFRFIPGL